MAVLNLFQRNCDACSHSLGCHLDVYAAESWYYKDGYCSRCSRKCYETITIQEYIAYRKTLGKRLKLLLVSLIPSPIVYVLCVIYVISVSLASVATAGFSENCNGILPCILFGYFMRFGIPAIPLLMIYFYSWCDSR